MKRRRQESLWLLFTLPSDTDFTEASSVQVSEQIDDRLKVMSSQPSTALLFLSTSALEHPIPIPRDISSTNTRPRACKQEKVEIPAYLRRALPDTCTLIGMTTDGIIGTVTDNCHPVELENCDAGSLLLLPKINGLGVHTFTLTEDAFSMSNPSREDLERISGIPDHQDIKVLFLFFGVDSSVAFTSAEDTMVKAFVYEYKDIVVAGGYVDNLIYMNANKTKITENDVAVGIALYGDRIKMASTILDQSVKSTKKAEECIKKLKDTNIPVDSSHHSFGFQFACVGRGYHQYHKNNVEADIFRKFFPNIPLLGFFGGGEIGLNYLPDYSGSETSKKEIDPFLRMNHSYTTIMCLLSVPKNKVSL
ncbi:F-box only protein 22-like isoform X2 [Lineus longissimus]